MLKKKTQSRGQLKENRVEQNTSCLCARYRKFVATVIGGAVSLVVVPIRGGVGEGYRKDAVGISNGLECLIRGAREAQLQVQTGSA